MSENYRFLSEYHDFSSLDIFKSVFFIGQKFIKCCNLLRQKPERGVLKHKMNFGCDIPIRTGVDVVSVLGLLQMFPPLNLLNVTQNNISRLSSLRANFITGTDKPQSLVRLYLKVLA